MTGGKRPGPPSKRKKEKKMTNDDIFHLAETHGWLDDFGRWNFKDEGLLRFVHEVREAEREACAKLCEEQDHNGVMIAKDCATAIRARGEK